MISCVENPLSLCHVLSHPCPKPLPQEIDRNELQLYHKLGEGGFGNIYYGKWRYNIEVAVTTLETSQNKSMKALDLLQNAGTLNLFKLKHKHLVALYGTCTRKEPMIIVKEFMSKGNLRDFLSNGEGASLKFQDLIIIASNVASGMEYFEAKKILHRNLAARHIFIGVNNVAKIDGNESHFVFFIQP